MEGEANILVYSAIRDREAKDRLCQLLEDLPGERVTATLYEVSAADWDEGLWDAEVERMLDIVDPATDTLIYWQVLEGKLVRTYLAGRFA